MWIPKTVISVRVLKYGPMKQKVVKISVRVLKYGPMKQKVVKVP